MEPVGNGVTVAEGVALRVRVIVAVEDRLTPLVLVVVDVAVRCVDWLGSALLDGVAGVYDHEMVYGAERPP